ncbi:TetR/AcrR family transcriptional regulator [Mycobacterium hodleri]|uniref:TetR/AcrR family transcriptional regulator n=1 Tax=Mycolicibacterium hodleri TaxID=49897 RepID=A0A544VV17_9MYCO|nr:TetR/AcrR family transcriptional regulator [Mycolicibacterium hodleri]TQR83822.1 TetR/AcrR family transcriptional regulator [Mycolicibacterium hodleri]
MTVVTGTEAEIIKRRILDAAAEAFMSQGFGVTTIDDVAERVGATKGLVYYHFRSKFDILLAVYERGMSQVQQQVGPARHGAGTGRERLTAMSTEHVVNLMSDLKYHWVVHLGVREQTSTALKPRQRDALSALNDLRRDYEQMFLAVVNDGIADGSIREVNAPLATRTLLSSLNAVDAWYRPRPDQTPEAIRALATEVVDLIVGGLLANTRREGAS